MIMKDIIQKDCRLRAVSLFSWSVEQEARDAQMTIRVTELTLTSRARALPLLNLKKKRDCSQSKKTEISIRVLPREKPFWRLR